MSITSLHIFTAGEFNLDTRIKLLGEVDRFYQDITFVKNIRRIIQALYNDDKFDVVSAIEIKHDRVIESYNFWDRKLNEVFFDIKLTGCNITALHQRQVVETKSIVYLNNFVTNIGRSKYKPYNIVNLLTTAFALAGSNYLFDTVSDDVGHYMVLEAIKSKLTLEFNYNN